MGPRPLRQYYDEAVRIDVDGALEGQLVEPWVRHRRRFVDLLASLSDEQWAAPTRCEGWDAQDVVSHLITADGFWVASLRGAASGAPTSYLPGFDPTDSPEALVQPMRSLTPAEVLDQFRTGTDAFVDAVTAMDATAWDGVGESPLGHVQAPLVLAHACWDSWLHERDISVPLGLASPVEDDELLIGAWYVLVAGAVQGGLLDDPVPVGPGLDEALDLTLAFEDLPDDPLHLAIDEGVRLERGGPDPVPAGRALDLVEGYTGRCPVPAGVLPPAVDEHLQRAFQIL
jgi:uncharacterized protein (TIGR03083 family)